MAAQCIAALLGKSAAFVDLTDAVNKQTVVGALLIAEAVADQRLASAALKGLARG